MKNLCYIHDFFPSCIVTYKPNGLGYDVKHLYNYRSIIITIFVLFMYTSCTPVTQNEQYRTLDNMMPVEMNRVQF